eukprot:GGOE01056842.1.p1 GENE.GGOE01056842.1~~GGOE01056842.1.p1  ORF type:complete len:552 (+),score=140.44 GGOE01056842.1:56-1657(+)
MSGRTSPTLSPRRLSFRRSWLHFFSADLSFPPHPMSGRTSPTLSPRRLSFRRSWLPYAQTDKVVIERLSKLALFERSKNKHRYRVVQDGVIVALLGNKFDVEEFLEKSKSLPDGPSLLRQVSSMPAEDSPVSSPRSPREESETGRTPEHRTSLDNARTSRSLPDSQPPGSGRRSLVDSDGVRSKLSSMVKAQAEKASRPSSVPEEDRLDQDNHLQQFLQSPPPNLLASALLTKQSLASDFLAARQRSFVKLPTFDLEPTGQFVQALTWTFNGEGKQWTLELRRVSFAAGAFAEGTIRQAFRMDMMDGKTAKSYVAKRFTPLMEESLIRPDPSEPGLDTVIYRSAMAHYASHVPGAEQEAHVIEQLLPSEAEMTKGEFMAWFRRLFLHRRDVAMQHFCQSYANAFNKRGPAKEVRFLPAFLLGIPREPYDLYFCEPYMAGHFEKYNNNDGGVNARANTPQAFSHFSYVHSGKQHVIVDIQGCGDVYTDPQVHSISRAFGIGNMQQSGIDKFLATHRCNPVCVRLGLSDEKAGSA